MTESPPVGVPAPPVKLVARLRAYFFAGVLVTAPAAITFYFAWAVVDFVDRRVTPWLPPAYNPENYLPFGLPGLGLLILVVLLTAIGALTAGFVGRVVVRTGERMLERMPVIRGLYSATKQIFETVLRNKSTAFREVVLVEYPRRGLWTIAFITGVTDGAIQELTDGGEVVNIFVPTTPNPTSGFLLFVPRTDLIKLDMTVDEGIKLVVSGGIVTPAERRAKAQPSPKDTALH